MMKAGFKMGDWGQEAGTAPGRGDSMYKGHRCEYMRDQKVTRTLRYRKQQDHDQLVMG